MSDHYRQIYEQHALEYDRMVAAEDCDDRLLPAIQAVCALDGIRVAEVGVGTGRVTRLLARGGVGSIVGVDAAPAMLEIAKKHMAAIGPDCSWRLEVADAAQLPIADDEVDLFVAGWTFGHSILWRPDAWPGSVDRDLREAERVTRPGGFQILFETLGTGALVPAPPTPELAAYYTHLEKAHGFRPEQIRTDYVFDSADAAARACEFFFGAHLCNRIREENWTRVPEWTGMWWRQLAQ